MKGVPAFMLQKADNVINLYKKKGIAGVARAILRHLNLFFSGQTLNFLFLDLSALPGQKTIKSLFRIVAKSEINSSREYFDGFNSKRQAISKIDKGDLLFVHERDGKKVYFVWIEQKKISIDCFAFNLPEDVAYLANEYTLDEYRGKGIAKEVRAQIFQYLKERGIRYLILVINPENIAASRLNKSCGFKEYQLLRYKCLFLFWIINLKSSDNVRRIKKFKLLSCPENIWIYFADFYKNSSLLPGNH